MRKKRKTSRTLKHRTTAKILWLTRHGQKCEKETPEENKHQTKLVEGLKEATRTARNGWLFLLTLSVITIVTIASVSHTDLLLNASVKLPVVQIGVPVSTFFVFAPIFLLVVHAEVLLRHADLARKARHVGESLSESERRALPGYHLVQIIVCRSRKWRRMVYGALHFITLMVLPLFVLLYAQSAYLPLHDGQITWLHRILASIDAIIIWIYGLSIWKASTIRTIVSAVAWAVPIAFSVMVATIPGEWQEKLICEGRLRQACVAVPFGSLNLNDDRRKAFWPTAWLFEGDMNNATGRLNSLMARNLVIRNRNLAGNNRDKPRLNLRNRDLRYADFSGSNLSRADFTASDLAEAKLANANLQQAVFGCADTGRAVPMVHKVKPRLSNPTTIQQICPRWWHAHGKQQCANLTNANLSGADLTGAQIGDAMLDGVDLSKARMPKATFSNSCLFMAKMSEAEMQGAKFEYSDLVGATMRGAKLAKATFKGSDLSLADLSQADLRYSAFHTDKFFEFYNVFVVFNNNNNNKNPEFTASLFAARLIEADLRCADFSDVAFLAADLTGAHIWMTELPAIKEHFSFSALDKIQIDSGGETCTNNIRKDYGHQINQWWKDASKKLRGTAQYWQKYVSDGLCYNIKYFRATPKIIDPRLIYQGQWHDIAVGIHTYLSLEKDSRINMLPEMPKPIPTLRTIAELHRIYTPPYINPEILWKRVKNGTCPAAEKLTEAQRRQLERWAILQKEKREKKAKAGQKSKPD